MYGRKVKTPADKLGDRRKNTLINRIGSAKNGHWEVIKKTKAIKG